MENLKIFLAGGNGFIGKNIKEQLGGKYIFISPSHDELDLTNTDAVYGFFKKNPVEAVINAAAGGVSRTRLGGDDVFLSNLKIFFNIVRAKPFFKRMIMLGSGAEYDKGRSLVKVKEGCFDKYVPTDRYGFYKYICAKYAERVDFITHLRLFGIFGKYEDFKTRLVSNVICMALFDLPIRMNQNVRFDYLFVDDFTRILERVIECPPKERFVNVGIGEPTDSLLIAEKILLRIGKKLPIIFRKDGLGNEYSADTRKLKKYLGNNFLFTPIDRAVDSLVEYYKNIISNLDKDDFLIVK